MQLSFRTTQLIGYAIVVGVMGTFTILAGISFISRTVVEEANLRVQMDLNSAWAAFDEEKSRLQVALSTIAQNQHLRIRLTTSADVEVSSLDRELEHLRERHHLDILTLVDKEGFVAARSSHSARKGQKMRRDEVIKHALEGHQSIGTVIVSQADLCQKSNDLAARAMIPLVPTERARPTEKLAEDRGMMLETAIPVLGSDNAIIGILYGGVLLNRQVQLVDKIRNAVFGDQIYNGKPLGTVTVFLWDVRIATNVIKSDSTRAIGTRVSDEVYAKVLEQGERFAARAFVVNDWYLSAYDPIKDPAGNTIGILYVGILEQKYLDYGQKLMTQFLVIALAALILSVLLALYLSGTLRRPILALVRATREIAAGHLGIRVNPNKGGREISELAQAFNAMAQTLEEHSIKLGETTESMHTAFQEAEEKNRAYREMLGFVTHELKSPLASIVFAIGSLREHVFGDLNREQESVLKSASNSAEYLNSTIANYLNLNRLEEGGLKIQFKEVFLVRDILGPVLSRMNEIATDNRQTITTAIPDSLRVWCDADLLTSVFQNLLSNAVKYGSPGGFIVIGMDSAAIDGSPIFYVFNEGQGFTREEVQTLFIKFSRFSAANFSTKSGTGLGLYVTKNIIERHGGRIWAESKPGEWARFSFSVPAPEEAEGTSV